MSREDHAQSIDIASNGEFQHQRFTFGSLHDSDHVGVVNLCRPILSLHSNITYYYQFFPYQECNFQQEGMTAYGAVDSPMGDHSQFRVWS